MINYNNKEVEEDEGGGVLYFLINILIIIITERALTKKKFSFLLFCYCSNFLLSPGAYTIKLLQPLLRHMLASISSYYPPRPIEVTKSYNPPPPRLLY
jgi:hypothetical protein